MIYTDNVHLMDTALFKGLTCSAEMRDVYNERAHLQSWIDAEAALAKAQAELGIIPEEAAEAIVAKADANLIDVQNIVEHGKKTAHTLMGLLTEYRKNLPEEYQNYLHNGATTQDIIDSGTMLLAARAHDVIEKQLVAFLKTVMELMRKHRDTVMVARSHGNHALPFTFGLKMAGWLDEMGRNLERWREIKDRCLVGSMSGAIGTYAAWKEKGLLVQERSCHYMGLKTPKTWWHSQRDRLAELCYNLSLIGGTCSRIAQEVYVSSMTEIGELAEGYTKGIVGSSTMPHKINPIVSEWVFSLSRIVRGNADVMGELMAPLNERDGCSWRAEWVVLPEIFCAASAMLAHIHKVVSNLQVNEKRMLDNVNRLKGVLLSEKVMFVLAKGMSLADAHHLVYEISLEALAQDRPLVELLMENEHVAAICSREELETALDPNNYLGQSGAVVDLMYEEISTLIKE
ncbi:MAG: adenylosuccinate lyase [Proteobacteria bacterium]|nr:MAG: adenylosuccinate lyase [Pseudomonadota bacterium]